MNDRELYALADKAIHNTVKSIAEAQYCLSVYATSLQAEAGETGLFPEQNMEVQQFRGSVPEETPLSKTIAREALNQVKELPLNDMRPYCPTMGCPPVHVGGLADHVRQLLLDAGYETCGDLMREVDSQLLAIDGVGSATVDSIRRTTKDLVLLFCYNCLRSRESRERGFALDSLYWRTSMSSSQIG